MTTPAVHWYEGMFLRPHHFQAAQRHALEATRRHLSLHMHHDWGLRSIEIDRDALANYRFVVRSISARLRDGSLYEAPGDGVLPAIDLKPAFEALGTRSLTVSLALPVYNPSGANAASARVGGAGEASESARFLVASQTLEDENTGVNPQTLDIRRLNVGLLLSTRDQTGYETLPIARLTRSMRADAAPELDATFIPAVVACDAWPGLYAGILQSVRDRIGKKIELLATQVTARAITFDSHAQGDPLIFAQLRELNEAYSVLGVLASTPGVHPFEAYVELARIVGQLAIFGATRRAPEPPRYDHDDLGPCFHELKKHIDALLNIFVEPEYKERPFIGAGLRMQVALEPAWLESVWKMYIGVLSPLEVDECIAMLTRAGRLDMKIGSSERADTIFRLGQAGLRFSYDPHPPRALPTTPGLIFFQIDRESSLVEWQNVQRSLTLAFRLNENLITGNIQGQRVLTIKTGGQGATMQFTLYVVSSD